LDTSRGFIDLTQASIIDPTKATGYPADAKVRENARKKALNGQVIGITVKKRHKLVEDHHDDGGDDLPSLDKDTVWALLRKPCNFDTNEKLSVQDHSQCLVLHVNPSVAA
jgi:hypothetical protein